MNVVKFPSQKKSVEETLAEASETFLHYDKVIIIGYKETKDEVEYELLLSHMTNAEALWILESTKRNVIND